MRLSVDRPGNDDLEVPAARDSSRPEGGESSPDRGAVLTDARMRQAYALAYRATVEAAYAREESEVVRGSADQARPNIVEKYSADYVPATHEPPHVDGPHEPPEKWVRDINLDADLPGRRNNCGECSSGVLDMAWGAKVRGGPSGRSFFRRADAADVNAGHWFNAVNDGGTLKTVEGQRNRVGSWPPVYRVVGFDESMMRFSDAIFYNPNGKIVPNDNL